MFSLWRWTYLVSSWRRYNCVVHGRCANLILWRSNCLVLWRRYKCLVHGGCANVYVMNWKMFDLSRRYKCLVSS